MHKYIPIIILNQAFFKLHGDYMPITAKGKAKEAIKGRKMPKLPNNAGKIRKIASNMKKLLEQHKEITDLITQAHSMHPYELRSKIRRIEEEVKEVRHDLIEQYLAPVRYGVFSGTGIAAGAFSKNPVFAELIGGVLGAYITLSAGLLAEKSKGKTMDILREQKSRKAKIDVFKEVSKLPGEDLKKIISRRRKTEREIEKMIDKMNLKAREIELKKMKRESKLNKP